MAIPPRQTPVAHLVLPPLQRVRDALERVLEAERDQLPLWLPVALGCGIAGWFALPDPRGWIALIGLSLAVATLGALFGGGGRLGRLALVGGLAVALGCGLVWARADRLAAPVLAGPTVVQFSGTVERVQVQVGNERVRVVLGRISDPGLPPRLRVSIPDTAVPERLAAGDRLALRARLVPPPPPTLPGGYDFARAAWFQQLGATGRALGPVTRIGPAHPPGLRDRLTAHIRSALPTRESGIAVALATGDQGVVTTEDAEALRRAGLAHLLSVSGLHLTAVVGGAMLVTLSLLALSPRLARSAVPLPLVAALVGAATGVFYTWLSGAEVPTIRACVATLLVLAGLAIGREALTLRLVATGAVLVLLAWPESLVGASFQLSFAAVTAIVALYDHPAMRRLMAARDEPWLARLGRNLGGLLVSGLVVELALAPIALFHFHTQGLLGAMANLVAIPFTTFVLMPLEAAALLFDSVGLGAPFWWAAAAAIRVLLDLAEAVAAAPWGVVTLATMPAFAFALLLAGGLMLCLLVTRLRWLGLVPALAGIGWALASPTPDLLVTGDGMHVAIRTPDGRFALLRPRAGDYVRRVLAESAGMDGELGAMDDAANARCGADSCTARIHRDGRRLDLLATRSLNLIGVDALAAACTRVDVVVADRVLPRACRPRWLRLDRAALARTGGVAIEPGTPWRVRSVAAMRGRHPWVDPPHPPRARLGKAKGGRP
jgi:competence protein ComEC